MKNVIVAVMILMCGIGTSEAISTLSGASNAPRAPHAKKPEPACQQKKQSVQVDTTMIVTCDTGRNGRLTLWTRIAPGGRFRERYEFDCAAQYKGALKELNEAYGKGFVGEEGDEYSTACELRKEKNNLDLTIASGEGETSQGITISMNLKNIFVNQPVKIQGSMFTWDREPNHYGTKEIGKCTVDIKWSDQPVPKSFY